MFISKNWRKIDKKIGHHQDQPSSGQAAAKVGRPAGPQQTITATAAQQAQAAKERI